MEVTIVEPSLHSIVTQAMELAKDGYELTSVEMLGWTYELRMSKQEDKTPKTKVVRGTNGNKE